MPPLTLGLQYCRQVPRTASQHTAQQAGGGCQLCDTTWDPCLPAWIPICPPHFTPRAPGRDQFSEIARKVREGVIRAQFRAHGEPRNFYFRKHASLSSSSPRPNFSLPLPLLPSGRGWVSSSRAAAAAETLTPCLSGSLQQPVPYHMVLCKGRGYSQALLTSWKVTFQRSCGTSSSPPPHLPT